MHCASVSVCIGGAKAVVWIALERSKAHHLPIKDCLERLIACLAGPPHGIDDQIPLRKTLCTIREAFRYRIGVLHRNGGERSVRDRRKRAKRYVSTCDPLPTFARNHEKGLLHTKSDLQIQWSPLKSYCKVWLNTLLGHCLENGWIEKSILQELEIGVAGVVRRMNL